MIVHRLGVVIKLSFVGGVLRKFCAGEMVINHEKIMINHEILGFHETHPKIQNCEGLDSPMRHTALRFSP